MCIKVIITHLNKKFLFDEILRLASVDVRTDSRYFHSSHSINVDNIKVNKQKKLT
jgi:hypothetical protein